ncbi:class I SAM-dependent methyltransferase [Paenibacillus lautus]|uniref:class I SAM-dependent methyltransferase n=1 Tax=Paenibacillus lautus TaxID=1401 RepID=UPI001BCF3A7A
MVVDAKQRGGRILDIGCGDGLLLERLAPFASQVVGIELDTPTFSRAQARLEQFHNYVRQKSLWDYGNKPGLH